MQQISITQVFSELGIRETHFKVMATKLWKLRTSAWEFFFFMLVDCFFMHKNVFMFAEYITSYVPACYLANTALTFRSLKESFVTHSHFT